MRLRMLPCRCRIISRTCVTNPLFTIHPRTFAIQRAHRYSAFSAEPIRNQRPLLRLLRHNVDRIPKPIEEVPSESVSLGDLRGRVMKLEAVELGTDLIFQSAGVSPLQSAYVVLRTSLCNPELEQMPSISSFKQQSVYKGNQTTTTD